MISRTRAGGVTALWLRPCSAASWHGTERMARISFQVADLLELVKVGALSGLVIPAS